MKLTSLSLNELESLQKKVNREIQKRRSKTQEEGFKKIKLIAAEYGLTANELKGISSGKRSVAKKKVVKTRGPVAPKYRDPSNSENTWTGRGRKPKWVEAFLNGGGRLEQITI
jgi:DNA-binding protein H-NS